SDADPAFVRSWREEDDYRLFGLYAGGERRGDSPTSPASTRTAASPPRWRSSDTASWWRRWPSGRAWP
ncbi:MAG: hypothetical protein ABEJ04_03700, partial [Halobacteriaceae archaeon]